MTEKSKLETARDLVWDYMTHERRKSSMSSKGVEKKWPGSMRTRYFAGC